MIAIGIDPGKTGAIAVHVGSRPHEPGEEALDVVRLFPMPVVEGKSRSEYDLTALRRLLGTYVHSRDFVGGAHVFIERQQAIGTIPGRQVWGGARTNFSLGFIQGALEGMLVGIVAPYTMVTPRRWQADMLEGASGTDTKQKSIVVAQRLFPSVDLRRTPRSRKPDSGFADALLIAEWGWRQMHR